MDVQKANLEIEESMRKIVRNLFKEDKVDVVIGYGESTTPLSIAPVFIKKEEDVDKLIWNNLCYVNLAKYLIPTIHKVIDKEKVDLRVGVVSKGCVGRTILQLATEHQINFDNIKIIGVPCDGMIDRQRIEKEFIDKEIYELTVENEDIIIKGKDLNEKVPFEEYMSKLCKACKIKTPPKPPSLADSDVFLGACIDVDSIEENFADVDEIDALSPQERWEHMKELLKNCEKCYACREACPFCYCNMCFVDQNKPTWFGKTSEFSDIWVYQLIRAFHVGGRCVACGACTAVCPVGINLNEINRKLQKIVKERYNYTAGIDPEILPPMMTHTMEDGQEFMLEED